MAEKSEVILSIKAKEDLKSIIIKELKIRKLV